MTNDKVHTSLRSGGGFFKFGIKKILLSCCQIAFDTLCIYITNLTVTFDPWLLFLKRYMTDISSIKNN